MRIENIPVTIRGLPVGTAQINDDGTIDLAMGTNHPLVKEMAAFISRGLVSGLSIVPVPIAAGAVLRDIRPFSDPGLYRD